VSHFWEINRSAIPDVTAPAVQAFVMWEEGEIAPPKHQQGDQVLGQRTVMARQVHVVDFYRSKA
jgi:hypothetical protein